jgi:PucR family transcriptional regulator, purine catabolism regulatory protein
MISVHDILQHSLPPGTSVVAGKRGLDREVTWATRLRPAPPAFGHLSGGEIVLLPPDVLGQLDERLTLADAIRQLAGFNVAAIAVTGSPEPGALTAADEAALPLLVLPAPVDFSALERETSRAISERRRLIQYQGQEAGRRLMELAIAGESLTELTAELSRLSQRVVALEGRDGRLLAFQPHPNGASDPAGRRVLEQTRSSAHGWLRSVGASSAAEPPTQAWTTDNGWTRIVAPVSGRDGLLGNLSIIARAGEERQEDGMLVSRAAAACAVTLAREHAAANARREVELNVLDEMLDGALRSEVSLIQQAQRLGHDLNQSFCAMIARLDPAPGAPARSREGRWTVLEEGLHRASQTRQAKMLWRVRNTSAEIVWPISEPGLLPEIIRTTHNELNAALQEHRSSEVVSIGVGRLSTGVQGIRHSHQEARQALMLGRRLHGPGHVTTFDDLGIYRLIFAAEQLPELQTFQDEALGNLLAYDTQHGSNLIQTLEAFFAANCSPKEAATLLQVHRNTVLYRLERIADITGVDLNAPDVRLRLHLALHVRLALEA